MKKGIEKQLILKDYTKDQGVIEELLAYCENKFQTSTYRPSDQIPLTNEPFVAEWKKYKRMSQSHSLFDVLQQNLVQLQFPIQAGISETPGYRQATLKGVPTSQIPEAKGIVLKQPATLQLRIYPSMAGEIPVISTANKSDFETLVQALSLRNEPGPIHQAMGACFVRGLNNWARIYQLKEEWLAAHPTGNWTAHFKDQVLPNKGLYQDKLILLSNKDYSGLPSGAVGLSPLNWKEKSMEIRLEHECAHYFTLRYFGGMANNMHDELIADYMGIAKARKTFSADWFLHFLGLENPSSYRQGGRLEHYTANLSQPAFNVLKKLLDKIARHTEKFDKAIKPATGKKERSRRLLTLASLSLIEIGAEDGVYRLLEAYRAIK